MPKYEIVKYLVVQNAKINVLNQMRNELSKQCLQISESQLLSVTIGMLALDQILMYLVKLPSEIVNECVIVIVCQL